MALPESADAGNFVALITKQISGMNTALRLFCKTNKKSLEEHLKSSNVIQDLRLTVDTARLREMVKLSEEVQWVDKSHPLTNKYSVSSMTNECS